MKNRKFEDTQPEYLEEKTKEWVDKIHKEKGIEELKQILVDLIMCEGSDATGMIARYLKEERDKKRT